MIFALFLVIREVSPDSRTGRVDCNMINENPITTGSATTFQLIMKHFIKSKMFWFSLIVLAIGIAFGYLENTFYQYVDESGVLHESYFMPLSFLCIAIGGIGFFVFVIKTIWLTVKKRTS